MSAPLLQLGVLPNAADFPSKDELLRTYEAAMYRAHTLLHLASRGMDTPHVEHWDFDRIEYTLMQAGCALIDARSAIAALYAVSTEGVSEAVNLVNGINNDPFLNDLHRASKGGGA